MAGKPIKISILADARVATKNVNGFADSTEQAAERVVTSLGDSKLQGSFGKMQEGFDVLDTRAMGFRDTITGLQDTSTAIQAFMGEGEAASASFGDKLLLLGTGVGDLASGFANFLIPVAAAIPGITGMAGAMKALNLTFLTNPVFLVIAAIVALVAVFVIAYKKSETFRNIVDGAFKFVLNTVKNVWGWIKGNWPLLLAIITGPIGLAVGFVVRNFDRIMSVVRGIPGKIKSAFNGAGSWLTSAGKNIVTGLWNGISSLAGWIKDKVSSLAGWLPGWVKSRLGIQSPSRVFMQLGQYTAEGFGEGLERRSRIEQGRAQRSFDRITDVGTISPGAPGRGTPSGGIGLDAAAVGDPVVRAIIRELQKATRVNGSLGVA